MNNIERELDRALTLLRNKIRERGFTQLEVQEALGWGRSYISQLLTKQKSLRLEQVLLILEVIKVPPAEFFSELYNYPPGLAQRQYEYGPPVPGRAPYNPSAITEPGGEEGDFSRSLSELRSMLRGLLRLLVDKQIVDVEELSSAVQSPAGGPILGETDGE